MQPAMQRREPAKLGESSGGDRSRPSPDEILAVLEPFTGSIDARTGSDLAEEVQWLAIHRGSELMTEGAPGDGLYIVVSGHLDVMVDQGDGTSSCVAEIGPGESVGESALLTDERRTSTVRVASDS